MITLTYEPVFSDDRREGDALNEVRASPAAYSALVELSGLPEGSRILVGLSRRADLETGQGLLVYAVKGEDKEGGKELQIPLRFVAHRDALFGPGSRIGVTPVTPVTLSMVVLVTSEAGFRFSEDRTGWAAWIRGLSDSGHVIRTDEALCHGGFSYRIVLSEPVSQGLVSLDATQLVVLSRGEEEEDEEEEDELRTYSEHIGGDFSDTPVARITTSSEHTPDVYATLSRRMVSNKHSVPKDVPPSPTKTSHAIPGVTVPLTRPVLRSQAFPAESEADEDECDIARVYFRSFPGLRPGDHALIHHNATQRLVRVLQLPKAFPTTTTPLENEHQPLLFAPPQLLANLHVSLEDPHVLITPLKTPPRIPLASSVTVARIASAHSVNRIYEGLFLDALKHYFQSKKRVHAVGDIICVGIAEDRLKLSSELHVPFGRDVPDALVSFQVVAIEEASAEEGEEKDEHAGRLGLRIDPSVTKLTQKGVVKSLVPDVYGFLGIAHQDAIATAASVRLSSYISATLQGRFSSSFNINLSLLLKGSPLGGKATLVRSVARHLGLHIVEIDAFDLVGETDVKTEGYLRARVEKAQTCAPCILLLRHIEALAKKSQALETGQEPSMTGVFRSVIEMSMRTSDGFPMILIATTSDAEKLTAGMLGCFKEEVSLDVPNERERLSILEQLTEKDLLAPDVSLRSVAVQTAALVAGDLVDLVRRARLLSVEAILKQTKNAIIDSTSIALSGPVLTAAHFSQALDKARSSYSENIGAPKIPTVTWDDVGGLGSAKDDILDTIQLPLERPELFADGLKKRSGILLYGPPGTGKTLVAKAVATSCSLNFFSVKGPELLNMYIGESEANVRRVFSRARDASPCVIFFDELDSVAPKRGNQGDSGGVMDRIVSQLLAELDGMASGKGASDVFVIGATNRPDLLDPALLRPGRFDKMIYLGVSESHEAQLKIIEALTRKFKLAPGTRLENVAQQCPFHYTGADFYALCSDAMLKAMTRKASEIDQKVSDLNATRETPVSLQYFLSELASNDDTQVLVAEEDFFSALKELVPSVSAAEMEHYRKVQRRFSEKKPDDEDEEEDLSIDLNGIDGSAHIQDVEQLNGLLKQALLKKKTNGRAPLSVANGAQHVETNGKRKEEKEETKKNKGKGRLVE